MKKKLQIIIPIIVIILIIGIVLVKNNEDITKEDNQNITSTQLNINDVDLEELKKHNLPVIIDFGADWCAPCKAMKPTLEKLNKDMQGKAIIQYLDIDKYPNVARRFPVELIPTQLFINKDGSPYIPSEEIEQELDFKKYYKSDDGSHYYTTHSGYLSEEQMIKILKDMEVNTNG